MLNRRLLRVKALQALYAYFQSSDKNVARAEKELFHSIERVYDLYIYLLSLPSDLARHANLKLEEAKNKALPTKEDLNPNTKFVTNKLIEVLENDATLSKIAERRKISWSADQELVSRLFKKIKSSDNFDEYLNGSNQSFENDCEFIIYLFKNVIFKFDLIEHAFEDRSIYWSFEEFDYACMMVRNTLKKVEAEGPNSFKILKLYKDEEDDRHFVKNLFLKTIEDDAEISKLIANKTKNWEVERIALIDVIMMKMAVTELMNFKSIPVKVTLNEYIEIAKSFSSPKSKTFINGVLDQLIKDLRQSKKLVKTGRGLME